MTPEALRREMQTLLDEASAATAATIATLQASVADLESDVAGLESDVAGLEAEVASLETDLAALTTTVAGLFPAPADNANRVLYSDGTALAFVPLGSNGEFLKMVDGSPEWGGLLL